MAVLEVADPVPGRDDVVVFCPARDRYLRVGRPQWAFLRGLDGSRTIAELERDVCGRLLDGAVRPLLTRFVELGLLEGGGEDGRQRKGSRLRVTRLGAVQFCVVNPDRFLDRFVPLIHVLGGGSVRALSAFVVVVGLCSMVVHADLGAAGLERLGDPVWTATLFAGMVGCGVLHELGHAGAVKYFGGRVRRMGVMLFYLAPALFCDTSDAWRFPRNRQRAVVAVAGVWVQMVVAGLALIVLWLPVSAAVAVWLWSFALVNIGLCVVNLIPLVELDGYWALVALTDVPHLRSRALGYLRVAVLRVVLGVGRSQAVSAVESPGRPVLVLLFGLGCALFPAVLVLMVVLSFQDVLLGFGRPGALVWLLVAGSVAAVPRKGLFRLVRAARGWPGSARWRAGLVGGVGVLVAVGVLVGVWVPLTVQGRFEVSEAGQVVALVPVEAGGYLGVGDHAELRGSWPVDRPFVAQGVLAADLPSGDRKLRYSVVLDGARAPELPWSATGPLWVRAGKVSPRAWLWSVYLQPALSTLRGEYE
ncbi:MAG: daptide biosynthesis intramembrane metalloprotease [Egibacteraceae bacterium]